MTSHTCATSLQFVFRFQWAWFRCCWDVAFHLCWGRTWLFLWAKQISIHVIYVLEIEVHHQRKLHSLHWKKITGYIIMFVESQLNAMPQWVSNIQADIIGRSKLKWIILMIIYEPVTLVFTFMLSRRACGSASDTSDTCKTNKQTNKHWQWLWLLVPQIPAKCVQCKSNWPTSSFSASSASLLKNSSSSNKDLQNRMIFMIYLQIYRMTFMIHLCYNRESRS